MVTGIDEIFVVTYIHER